ncbi:MAG: hypothetical protein IKM38_03950 [Christensenellaceae bacterium]|nr:hypothetical protein [Christensenellaceae bacterium]
MPIFTIKTADHVARVHALFESTKIFCAEYLTEEPEEFSVSVSEADIEFEREKSAKEDALEGIPVRNFSDAYLETIAVQRKITEKLFEYDTLLFHGSVIAVDGEAFLFTAKSGTGKSTHTRLWREVFGSRAVMINDDKPFLKITEKDIIAFGTPWNGKHRLSQNIAMPLSAICILERGEENRIAEISPKEALMMLFQQSNRPQNKLLMPKYLDLIDNLAKKLRFFRLYCNMEKEAALVSYRSMTKRKDQKHED